MLPLLKAALPLDPPPGALFVWCTLLPHNLCRVEGKMVPLNHRETEACQGELCSPVRGVPDSGRLNAQNGIPSDGIRTCC